MYENQYGKPKEQLGHGLVKLSNSINALNSKLNVWGCTTCNKLTVNNSIMDCNEVFSDNSAKLNFLYIEIPMKITNYNEDYLGPNKNIGLQ